MVFDQYGVGSKGQYTPIRSVVTDSQKSAKTAIETMNPENLRVTKHEKLRQVQPNRQYIQLVADDMQNEYEKNKAEYERFQALRDDVDVTGRNIRLLALWTIASIKTDTRLVDSQAENYMTGDFSIDKEQLELTTDGEVKWSCYGEWFSSNKPDRVAELLQNDRVMDAHALLAGRDPDTGKQIGEYYLRTCKASLVLYFLGYDRICVDSRIYDTLAPAIGDVFEDIPVNHPETEHNNPYRNSSPRQTAKKLRIITHSSDDRDNDRSYWEDKLKWNP